MFKSYSFGIAFALAACGTQSVGGPGPDPNIIRGDRVAAALSESLWGLAEASPDLVIIDRELTQPVSVNPLLPVSYETCELVEQRLAGMCNGVVQDGIAAGCGGTTTFFWAHDVPRCAGRIELWTNGAANELVPTIVFDLTGEPVGSGPEHCGDGLIDLGEQCDDGNREAWDGCDPHCMPEEFQGCEAVIEEKFAAQGLAFVDRTLWSSPRSHLMVNTTAEPLRAIDAAACAEAATVAQASCAQLSADMPFVSWCYPTASYAAGACTVRLQVGFAQIEPLYGVFTTGLTGILSFTLR
jgi:cysteine-rich repeat protein